MPEIKPSIEEIVEMLRRSMRDANAKIERLQIDVQSLLKGQTVKSDYNKGLQIIKPKFNPPTTKMISAYMIGYGRPPPPDMDFEAVRKAISESYQRFLQSSRAEAKAGCTASALDDKKTKGGET